MLPVVRTVSAENVQAQFLAVKAAIAGWVESEIDRTLQTPRLDGFIPK